jgi:hypothetical protein
MQPIPFLAALLIGLLFLSRAEAVSISLVAPKTGGLANIDNTTSQIWNFTISQAGAAAGLSVVSGNFAIKVDQGATLPIAFRFYQGFSYNSTGGTTLLGQVSRNPGDFTTNSFTPTLFAITPTGNLTEGAYSLMLTTSGITNDAYNMKGAASAGDPIGLFNSTTGTAVSGSYFANAGPNPTPYATPTPGPTPVPESGQVAASFLAVAGIGLYLWQRRQAQRRSASESNI